MSSKIKVSRSRIVFQVFNYAIFILLSLACLLPMVHVLALSFSSSAAASSGKVGLLPVGFTTDSYEYVASKSEFWQATLVSLKRVLLAKILILKLDADDGFDCLSAFQGSNKL